MKRAYLDSNLRRTSIEEDAVFVENCGGTERGIRCYRENTVRAAHASAMGRNFHLMGEGDEHETLDLNGLTFTWSFGRSAWAFSGPFYNIELKPSCSRESAGEWMQAFFEAETQSNALHRGQKVTHIVGATQRQDNFVAIANENTITWFNLAGKDALFTTTLADATKDSEYPIKVTRMIHHEVAHTFEPAMRDWLNTLTPLVAHTNLEPIAQKLNPQYLPARIEKWALDRNQNPENALALDEDMAAEFLVEFHAHFVAVGKPWEAGLWPALDAVADHMKARILTPSPTAGDAHRPIPQRPERIMHVPSTIIVRDPADRHSKLLFSAHHRNKTGLALWLRRFGFRSISPFSIRCDPPKSNKDRATPPWGS